MTSLLPLRSHPKYTARMASILRKWLTICAKNINFASLARISSIISSALFFISLAPSNLKKRIRKKMTKNRAKTLNQSQLSAVSSVPKSKIGNRKSKFLLHLPMLQPGFNVAFRIGQEEICWPLMRPGRAHEHEILFAAFFN